MKFYLCVTSFIVPTIAVSSLPEYPFSRGLFLRDLYLNQEDGNILFSRGGGQEPGRSSDHAAVGAKLRQQKSLSLTSLQRNEEPEDLPLTKHSQPPPVDHLHNTQGSLAPLLSSTSQISFKKSMNPSRAGGQMSPPVVNEITPSLPKPKQQKSRMAKSKSIDSESSSSSEHSTIGYPPMRPPSQHFDVESQTESRASVKTGCGRFMDACRKAGGVVARSPNAATMSVAAAGAALITGGVNNQNPLLAVGSGMLCAGLVCNSAIAWRNSWKDKTEGHQPRRRDFDHGFDSMLAERSLRHSGRGMPREKRSTRLGERSMGLERRIRGLDERSIDLDHDVLGRLLAAREVLMDPVM